MRELRVFGAGTFAGSAGTTFTLPTALEYLQRIYQDPLQPTSVRMKAAELALPFEEANGPTNGTPDFATQLEERRRIREAVERSNQTQREDTSARQKLIGPPSGRRF